LKKTPVPRFLVSLCSQILPQAFGGPDPKELSERVLLYLQRTDKSTRYGFLAGAFLLNKLITYKTKSSSELNAVDDKLSSLVDWELAYGLIEGIKSIILLVNGAYLNQDEITYYANKNPVARKDPVLNITTSEGFPSRYPCQVAIIGSGAGGAVAASVLAKKGVDVLIIEEGGYFNSKDFRSLPAIDRFSSMYQNAGATICYGLPPVVLPLGKGVGGTTLINSGTCYKTPEKIIEKWYKEFGIEVCESGNFNELLNKVESYLKVQPVPLDIMGKNGLTAIKGAELLNWKTGPLNRNADGCDGCCQCALGCPHNAKMGVHLSILPEASKNGAKIVSHLRAKKIVTKGDRASSIICERPDKSRVVIDCEIVILAAGAVMSPLVLRRSDLADHPEIGRNLAIHPATAVAGRFEDEIYPWRGVLQSASIEEFHHSDGILIEATSTPPGMGSMILPGIGKGLLEEIEASKHFVTLGGMVADDGLGKVNGKESFRISYQLDRAHIAKLLKATKVMAQVLFKAGAKEVITGLGQRSRAGSEAELEEIIENAKPRQMHLAAFHPVGTLRSGRDSQRCPTDANGKLRGYDNIYVFDASAVPCSPEVNPQVSIMSLSMGFATRLAENLSS
jgi:choline dehydrogenase-like flavoprotein